ncbi:MAG: hypothetical protein ACTSW4_04670 [Candidatus Ranarchaeia archaeon]
MSSRRRAVQQLSFDLAKAITSKQPWDRILDALIERRPIREIILRVLIDCDEAVSGVQLRSLLKNRTEDLMGKPLRISDTKLYYNLNIMQQSGLIEEKRSWREKIIGLNPEVIAPLRRYFGLQRPWAFMGLLRADETAVTVSRLFREKLEINPLKYFFLVRRIPPAGLWRPESTEWALLPNGINKMTFPELIQFARQEVARRVKTTDLILDVSGGTRLSLAMFKVAFEYGVNAVYLSRDADAEWLIKHDDF